MANYFYRVRFGQSLVDIAIQELGSIEALLGLAIDNNISVTDDVAVGDVLLIDESRIVNQKIRDYVAKNKPKEFKKFWDNLSKGIKQDREFSLNIDGKEVTISEVYTPIINEHKQVTKIINIGFDISEIKRKEKVFLGN